MRKCLVCLFISLSRLGLRNQLLRLFAFLPPKIPTYTFRLRANQKMISSAIATRHSQNTQVSGPSQPPKNDSMNLRIHRISSQITEKDFRPYKSDINSLNDQIVYNKSSSREELSSLASNSKSERSVNLQKIPNYISDQFHKPKSYLQYPVHDLKLIDKNRQVVDVDNPEDLRIDCYYLQTTKNQIIPVVFIQPVELIDYVLIYSHPNSTDVGLMLDNYLDLSYNLKINVLGYDYTGYGQSTGQPTDVDAIADIEAVYDFAVRQLGFTWEKVVLYGQSIGSGPSVTLVTSNYKFPVAGLIIHSGLASGLRVLDPTIQQTHYQDMFPNIDLIEYVNCLVYILHGDEDRQINQDQAYNNSLMVRNLYRYWVVPSGGHNNIEYEERFRKDYFTKLREFLREIRQRNSFYKPLELLKFNRAYQWSYQVEHYYAERMKSDVSSQVVTTSSSYPTLDAAPPSLFDRQNSERIDVEMTKVVPVEEQTDFSSPSRRRNTESPKQTASPIRSSKKSATILEKIEDLEEDFKQNDDSQISFCS